MMAKIGSQEVMEILSQVLAEIINLETLVTEIKEMEIEPQTKEGIRFIGDVELVSNIDIRKSGSSSCSPMDMEDTLELVGPNWRHPDLRRNAVGRPARHEMTTSNYLSCSSSRL